MAHGCIHPRVVGFLMLMLIFPGRAVGYSGTGRMFHIWSANVQVQCLLLNCDVFVVGFAERILL